MPRPKRRQRTPIEDLRDWGTPELRRHHMVVIEGDREARMGGKAEPHARVVDQRPLDRYALRKELAPGLPYRNAVLWRAGERLRDDWSISGLEPRTVAKLGAFAAGGSINDASERQIDAHRRLTRALLDVGTTLASVLVHVVCQDNSACDWAQSVNIHKTRGLPALRLALAYLAKHYGMAIDER